MCKNLHTSLGHHECMLPLSRWLLIAGDYLPSVWIVGIDEHLPGSHIDHWLDGEHHTRNEQHTRSSMTIVKNLRLLMELTAYTMTTEVTDHTITILLAMLLDGMTDITHKTSKAWPPPYRSPDIPWLHEPTAPFQE